METKETISKPDTGGAAFPGGVNSVYTNMDEGVPTQEGMSLRVYLAARAPKEIPSWFLYRQKFTGTAIRPASMDAGLNAQNPRLRAAIKEWWKAYNSSGADISSYSLNSVGETADEKAFLKKWEEEFTAYAEACELDRSKNHEANYFAWAFAWADAMIARSAI